MVPVIAEIVAGSVEEDPPVAIEVDARALFAPPALNAEAEVAPELLEDWEKRFPSVVDGCTDMDAGCGFAFGL